MEMALETAFLNWGSSSPNPSVGAVIVKEGRVLATGATGPCGDDHAEICAIKSAREDLRGAEIYVSLEPCCHFGKTPPCTDAIIRAGIARVYLPLLDPNPLVAGKGVAALKEAGIEVVMVAGMADAAVDLIRPFKKYILRKRPYVLHKSAVTLDGKIATSGGDSRWVSSEHARYLAHRLRSMVDGIIIGRNTMERDDPRLNVRLESFPDEVRDFFASTPPEISGRDSFFIKMLMRGDIAPRSLSPARIVIGLPEEIDFTKNLFHDDNYMFFLAEGKKKGLSARKDYPLLKKMMDGEMLMFAEGDTREGQVESILDELFRRGKMLLLLEGGGTLAGSFLDAGEIDQFLYILAPKVIGKGLSPLEGRGAAAMEHSLNLHDVTAFFLMGEIVYNAYREPYHFEKM